MEVEIHTGIDLELDLTEVLVGDEILFEMIEDLTEEDLMMVMVEQVMVDLHLRVMMIDNFEIPEGVDLIEIETLTEVDMIEDMKVEVLTQEEGMIEDTMTEEDLLMTAEGIDHLIHKIEVAAMIEAMIVEDFQEAGDIKS